MSQFISLQEAIDLTSKFRSSKEDILYSTYRGQGVLPICETFDRADMDDLLSQADCQKLRVYLGMDSNYKVKVVVVGVDSHDEDILLTGHELIAEDGHRNPPYGPPSSSLNS